MIKQITCVEIEVLLPAMAAGALDADDAHAVHTHLAICPPCLLHLRDFQAAVEQLAFAVPQVAPPAELRSRVLYLVAHSPAVAPAGPLSLPLGNGRVAGRRLPPPAVGGILPLYQRVAPALLAACLLLLAGMGVWAGTLSEQLAQQHQLLQQQAILSDMMHTPGVTLAALTAPANSGTARGQAVLAPRHRQVALLITSLPQATAGRRYQLWLLRHDAPPTPAGVFTVDDQGAGMVMVDTTADPTEMAGLRITDTPATDGSPAATGTTLLEGWYR